MPIVTSSAGTRVWFESRGHGPALVLVHGSFSDQRSNWALVMPELQRHFTVHAVARRGRGQTDATVGHEVADEGADVAAVVRALGEPAFLLGHSYGAHVALAAAAQLPDQLRALLLYEAPWPHLIEAAVLAELEAHARRRDWHALAKRFFGGVLDVPPAELEALIASEHWGPILADAPASLGDAQALVRLRFEAGRFAALPMPVLLQTGAASPREFYVTDALARVLPRAHVDVLAGQAHEAMTTAPQRYVEAVLRFLRPLLAGTGEALVAERSARRITA